MQSQTLGQHHVSSRTNLVHRQQQIICSRSRSRGCLVRATATGSDSSRTVAIAGAGIAGLAAAVGLHKLGVPVVVLERALELRQEGSALSLWANAWKGLDALGVSDQLRQHSPLLESVEFVSSKGKLLKQFNLIDCGKAATAAGGINETRGVSRPRLLKALADQLPAGTIKFNSRVTGVDIGGAGPVLQLGDGSSMDCAVLVGADGANSQLAQQLGLKRPNYAGYIAYRGLAEYPAGTSLPLPLNTIRQVFGCGVRAGMYPITEQQVYWFICLNAPEGGKPATAAAAVAEALSAVEGWSWGIQQAVCYTDPDSITRSAIKDRWTSGSVGKGCTTVIGDALHPMTPNLGQGGCTAIEDAVVLARQLGAVLNDRSSSKQDIEACLRRFEAERSQRCLAITVRANAMGAALQIPLQPVCSIRDFVLEHRFDPSHFLDHTSYDCGTLQPA